MRCARVLGGPGRIVWVGSRTVNCAAHPAPETVWPVRIARGAFGAGLPKRELFLSPEHAVFVGGVLVPVKLLVNGTSIAQGEAATGGVLAMSKLERHDVVRAEGLPAESYLDVGDRANFGWWSRNDPVVSGLRGEAGAGCGAGLGDGGIAELVTSGDRLDAIRRQVNGCAPQLRKPPGSAP